MVADHETRRQLGTIMVEEGFISSEQLAYALGEQTRLGHPLGKLLVELGFASEGAVANALAEQHGGLLKTEFGMSAGLHALPGGLAPVESEHDRVSRLETRLSEAAQAHAEDIARVTAAAASRIAELEAELAAAQALRAPEEATGAEHAHLLFVPSAGGYALVEWPGPSPASGALLDVDGSSFRVRRVGASPLPGRRLRCAFLERA